MVAHVDFNKRPDLMGSPNQISLLFDGPTNKRFAIVVPMAGEFGSPAEFVEELHSIAGKIEQAVKRYMTQEAEHE